jgi:hypothetical protein
MSGAGSFTKQGFTSLVSRIAFVLLILGIVVAWLSTDVHKRESLDAYLQSLSTGLIGIALTVWLVNFLIERQSHRLSSELRASTEIAALFRLQHFVHRLPQWLPKVDAPDWTHWQQLEWVHNQIDQVCALCDGIIPGPADPELQQSLTDLKLAQREWSDALGALDNLIHTKAPADDRAPAFTLLRTFTDRLLGSARVLEERLSNRHEHQKFILGIARV